MIADETEILNRCVFSNRLIKCIRKQGFTQMITYCADFSNEHAKIGREMF